MRKDLNLNALISRNKLPGTPDKATRNEMQETINTEKAELAKNILGHEIKEDFAKQVLTEGLQRKAEEINENLRIENAAQNLAESASQISVLAKADEAQNTLTEMEKARRAQEKQVNEMLEEKKQQQEKIQAQQRMKAAREKKSTLTKTLKKTFWESLSPTAVVESTIPGFGWRAKGEIAYKLIAKLFS